MKLINDSENPLLEVCLPSAHKIIPVRGIMYIQADRKGSIITICGRGMKEETQIRSSDLLKAYEPARTFPNERDMPMRK